MPENRHLRFLLRLLYAALALAGLWLALRFLLPWLLPFLLAFGLAALLEPAVRLLMERLHLPRRGAAALCTAAVLGGLALVVWRVGYELSLLLGRLPTLLAGLPTLADGLERWAYRFLIALPVQFQTLARDALEGLLEQGIDLPNRFYEGWLRPFPPPLFFSLRQFWPPISPAQAVPLCWTACAAAFPRRGGHGWAGWPAV